MINLKKACNHGNNVHIVGSIDDKMEKEYVAVITCMKITFYYCCTVKEILAVADMKQCDTAGGRCTPVTVELFHNLYCLFLVMVRLICQHYEIQALEFPGKQSSSHWSLLIQCLLHGNNTTKVTSHC